MQSSPIKIAVRTPSARYHVTIGPGLLATLYPALRKELRNEKSPKDAVPKLFVITSPEIWSLWADEFLTSFPSPPHVLLLPQGEASKRFNTVEALAEQLAANEADRDSVLIAFGGGVVGDITGFLAAIYMRGIRYVQVPTTLLAQVDSSIGGKTGVNLDAGKNLIGSFHHPVAVFADSLVLRTLPAAELRAGLQESIKAGVIFDASLFAYLARKKDAILAETPDPKALTRVVAASVAVKAAVVSKDEHESGLRMILNFGHTLGHAIEAVNGYGSMLHGEAVAWGSIAATFLGESRRTISHKNARHIRELILAYGPLPSFNATAEHLVALSANDKKNRAGKRAYVLPTGIGSAAVYHDVTDAEMLAAANQMLTLMQN